METHGHKSQTFYPGKPTATEAHHPAQVVLLDGGISTEGLPISRFPAAAIHYPNENLWHTGP